jgi:hypothetical protein
MGMTKLSKTRKTQTKKQNIGKIIIFCEGQTEKHYFDYFANIINNNKYSDVEVKTQCASGNAKQVLSFADKFLNKEENNRKYIHYNRNLVFDCDAPRNIQVVISEMLASDKKYNLVISNYLFELWLLMYFENVTTKLTRKKIYERLSNYLANGYKKADQGIIREIINNGNIEDAINNAAKLADIYKSNNKTIENDIKNMNPYTNVYELIEQFMLEIS